MSKLMKGMSRLQKRSDKRLPVTLSLLCDLIKILPAVCSSNFEASLFAAAFSVALFGFFRVGELVSSSGAGLEHVISIADVKFLNDNTLVEFGLRSSKTDANAEGAVLIRTLLRHEEPPDLLELHVDATALGKFL